MKRILFLSVMLFAFLGANAQMQFKCTVKSKKNTRTVYARETFENRSNKLLVGNKSTSGNDFIELWLGEVIQKKEQGYNRKLISYLETGTFKITGHVNTGKGKEHIALENGKGKITITKVNGNEISGTFTLSNENVYDLVECSGSFENLWISLK